MKRLLVILLVIAGCLAMNSYATGLGLSSNDLIVSMDFQPNFEGDYYYHIIPFTDHPIDISTYVVDEKQSGMTSDLAQYFTLSDKVFRNVLPNQQPYFGVHLKLPDRIDEPGLHKVRVGIVEALQNPSGISVRPGVEAIFQIFVPFEGKYLKYNIQAQGVNRGAPIPIIVTLSNLGTETIKNLSMVLRLRDSNNLTVGSTRWGPIELKGREEKMLNLAIPTIGIAPGDYLLATVINYDGRQAFDNQLVKVGELNFRIVNQTQVIFAGKINEITIDVESEWANIIKGVYAEVIVDGVKTKTISEDFAGFEQKTLNAFLDATDLKPGLHEMTINLYFGDKKVTKTVMINVIKEAVLESPSIELSLGNILLLVIVLIVVIINITLFMILAKKKDEHEKRT